MQIKKKLDFTLKSLFCQSDPLDGQRTPYVTKGEVCDPHLGNRPFKTLYL